MAPYNKVVEQGKKYKKHQFFKRNISLKSSRVRVTPKTNLVQTSMSKFNSNFFYIFSQKETQASTLRECEVKQMY